jgi:O-antigen/teichoic acid export membrane protein
MVDRIKIAPQLILLASFGGTSVLNYVFGLIMGWLLLPGDFGWLAFSQTVLLVSGLVLQSGFPWSLARSVVDAAGAKKDALVRGTLVANLTLAVSLGAIVTVLFSLGPLQPGLETGIVTAIVALSLPFISLACTTQGAAQGSEHFGAVAVLGTAEIFCKAVVGTVLVLAGFGVTGAVAGFLIGAIVASALGMCYLPLKLNVRIWGSIELPTLRAVGPMFGTLLGLSLLPNLSLFALKLLSDERTLTGYYQAGLVLANAPYFLVMAAIVPILFVRLARFKDLSMTREAMGEALSITAILVIPLELILTVLPQTALVTLFPDSYAPGAPALRLLAIGNSILIVAAILSTGFQAIGRAKVSALFLLTTAFVELVALWVATPTWGAAGVASIFVAASFVALFSLGATYLYELGINAVQQSILWLLRYVLALAISALAGRGALGISGDLNLAVCLGVGCYLASILPLHLIRKPVLFNRARSSSQTASGEG